jgi:hypothetical protein
MLRGRRALALGATLLGAALAACLVVPAAARAEAAPASSDAMLPDPADATRPPALPRLDFSLTFENDNKFFAIWQVFGTDGNDLGRTHALLLHVGRYVRPGLRWDLELGSEMFSAQLYDSEGYRLNLRPDGWPNPNYHKGRDIYFNELSWFMGRARGLFPGSRRFSWLLGGGVIVSNRAGMSPGATFFQRWFHQFLSLFEEDTKEYRYLQSGGVELGMLLEFGARVLGRLAERPRFRLRGFAEAALQANSLRHGTYIRAIGRMALDMGRRLHFDLPIVELALSQEARLYVGSADVMLDTQVDLFFHLRRLDVIFTFDGYYGNPHRRYFIYNFNNTTTTIGLGFRLP